MNKIILLLLFLLPLHAQQAWEEEQIDYQVQRLMAGFISNFPTYVTWPDSAFAAHPQEFWIGILGDDPLGSAGASYLTGRSHMGRNYVVHHLQPGDIGLPHLIDYQMLIVGDIPKKTVKHLLKITHPHPILTISTIPGFLEAGGIIEFMIRGKAVTWDVSLINGRNAHLRIDPLLVKYGKTM